MLAALLQVGAWTHAEKVMSRLPIHYAVAQPQIAEALQKLIHTTIQPIHKRYLFHMALSVFNFWLEFHVYNCY